MLLSDIFASGAGAFWGGAALQCVRENLPFSETVEQSSTLLAAKRRKNAAHGASRGEKCKADKPQRGERQVLTHTLYRCDKDFVFLSGLSR
jgi:hypothetical protein